MLLHVKNKCSQKELGLVLAKRILLSLPRPPAVDVELVGFFSGSQRDKLIPVSCKPIKMSRLRYKIVM